LLAPKSRQFLGGKAASDLHHGALKMQIFGLFQRCKNIAPLLAAPASLLLLQGQAKAILSFEILQTGSNVTINARGSIDHLSTFKAQVSVPGGAIKANDAGIAAGARPSCTYEFYETTGPSNFGTGDLFNADTSSGDCFATNKFGVALPVSCVLGAPLSASMTFVNKTLADFGLSSTSGLLGEWVLNGTSEKSQVWAGPAPTSNVPGPVPILGAAAAFGWCPRLRKRIATPLITPPQA
jgi:hypothetical protein